MMSKLVRKPTNESGFTLLEGLISIILVSITALGIYNMIILANSYIVDARRTTEATNFARMKLEKILDTDFMRITDIYPPTKVFDATPASYEPGLEQDPDYDYIDSLPNARWEAKYFDNNGAPISASVDPLTVLVTVYWHESEEDKEHSVQLSTRLTAGRI